MTKVKTYLIRVFETFKAHTVPCKQPLFELWREWYDKPTTHAGELKFCWHKAQYGLCQSPIHVSKHPCFAMQWPLKGQPADSLAQQICYMTEPFRSNYLSFECFGWQDVNITLTATILANRSKWLAISLENLSFLTTSSSWNLAAIINFIQAQCNISLAVMNHPTSILPGDTLLWPTAVCSSIAAKLTVHPRGGGGVLPEKLGRGVQPNSQNPYPIYDENVWFSLPYLWPDS